MTAAHAALKALDRVKARYEDDGYELSFEHRLAPPFDGFVADAVARRAGETVVVEVRPADMGNGTRDRLACLAEIIAKEPGWRLDIVTYEPETTPPAPDRDDSVRRVEEARRVVDVSPDGAVMLLWSAVEGALLRLSKDLDAAPDGSVPPRTLIHDLAIHGVISDNQAAELDDFARRRDAIAHGLASDPPSPDRLDWLARFALAAADGRIASVEDMIEWFRANYTSPEDAALLHDEELGDFHWMGAGPHCPRDVLHDHFDAALESDIGEAAEELERVSYCWASNDQLAAAVD